MRLILIAGVAVGLIFMFGCSSDDPEADAAVDAAAVDVMDDAAEEVDVAVDATEPEVDSGDDAEVTTDDAAVDSEVVEDDGAVDAEPSE